MNSPAPRSIDEYLKALRDALAGEDPALIQDALYDAEEYLRAEASAHPDEGEADVLGRIGASYGSPEEIAASYRETETTVKAALRAPAVRTVPSRGAVHQFLGIYFDPRAYSSLFFMMLTLATGIFYFTFVVTGLALSAGFSILIVGIPFFLAFIGVTRAIALGEGRLLEAITGERMPRRPRHPGPAAPWVERILAMLKDGRTWTTLAYLFLMLPLGIAYFVVAVVGLSLGVSFATAPIFRVGARAGWFGSELSGLDWQVNPPWLDSPAGLALMTVAGVVILTTLLHVARGVGRVHVRLAKALLVSPAA